MLRRCATDRAGTDQSVDWPPDGTPVPARGQGTCMMAEDAARRGDEITARQKGIDLGLALIDTDACRRRGGAARRRGSRRATPSSHLAGPAVAGTVLLVDDGEVVRTSTADMLIELGYVVIEVESGEHALRLVDDGAAFDMVVTDHLMPGMTGAELAVKVRRRRPGTPVPVISGYAELEGIAADLPRLTKPFRQGDLGASLAAPW